jgi:pimeloyl-ACP methyl ester carboxylesterase
MAERTEQLDDQPVYWREEPYDGAPTLYIHGVPNSSDLWLPFLERSGGIAPDLPGFGRSGKRADLKYDIPFYDDWIERFLDWRGIERVKLVVHDWGAVGLVWAQRFPERVERLVICDAAPLLPGYSPHRFARAARTRGLGELVMGALSINRISQRMLRHGNVEPLPSEFFDSLIGQFDQGTQRAILKLYRSVKPGELEAAGARLGELDCPALIVWGNEDPYVPPAFASAYANALGGQVQVALLDRAGHWPWYDRPEVVDRVSGFLAQ